MPARSDEAITQSSGPPEGSMARHKASEDAKIAEQAGKKGESTPEDAN